MLFLMILLCVATNFNLTEGSCEVWSVPSRIRIVWERNLISFKIFLSFHSFAAKKKESQIVYPTQESRKDMHTEMVNLFTSKRRDVSLFERSDNSNVKTNGWLNRLLKIKPF